MIIGHQKIREKLAHSVEKNAFVQTYLFVGPESVGKFEMAKEFALSIINCHPELACSDVSAVSGSQANEDGFVKKGMLNPPAGGQYDTIQTDLFILEPEREVEKGIVKERDISVERAREVSRWLGTFPYAARKKVLIIRDAHRLTESAQNALLKIMEEPPSYAVIILVTHELGKILPTTLSRCQQISFQLVLPEEISEGIVHDSSLATLPSRNKFLLELGRPGLVMQSFHQEEEFTVQLAILEKLMHLSEKPLRERLVLSESCVTNMLQTMKLLMWWVGGLHMQILVASTNDSVLQMMNIEKIEKLRGDLKRSPSSARLLLDTFFLHW